MTELSLVKAFRTEQLLGTLRFKLYNRKIESKRYRLISTVAIRMASPLAAYKEVIDQLVSETSHGISEALVVEKGIFGIAQDDHIFNSFVRSLDCRTAPTL